MARLAAAAAWALVTCGVAADSASAQDGSVDAYRLHLPVAMAAHPWEGPSATATPSEQACLPLGGTDYGTLPIVGPPTDRPAVVHPDLNLAVRGWVPTVAALRLVDYGGQTDPNAPELVGLLGLLPQFSSAFRVNDWDWEEMRPSGPITQWPVTLLGLQTAPGQPIAVPGSGYAIGSGYSTLVLYANPRRITLKYTREDNVVQGYTLHLEGLCVDPPLKALYDQMNRAGRSQLPALRAGEQFATAQGHQVLVAIRDSGMFMDPRSRKDWWPGLSDEPTPEP